MIAVAVKLDDICRLHFLETIVFIEKNGAPGEIRTPGLLVRSQTLYPAELRAHCVFSGLLRVARRSTLFAMDKQEMKVRLTTGAL